ncbi:hypothetical protein [Draconibacterium mangrovi]|uniref:hypothetical protein n=1 Tax=Draconibacterium mangrovi TaxID=2697469 RepID=UPI0013D012DF|nr:hypothetical protein [Draconibacterium mangrovi]
MIGNELKIKFRFDKAYLVDGHPLSLSQLEGFPKERTFEEPAFWVIKVLNYRPNENKLFVDILEYNIGESQFNLYQTRVSEQLSKIERISFNGINTGGLLNTIRGRSSRSLRHKSYDSTRPEFIKHHTNPPSKHYEPERIQIIEKFFVPIKKLLFGTGEIFFKKKFTEYLEPIELTISNHHIREEFEAVKTYFSNVLRTKKIQVSVKIEIVDSRIVSKMANSIEIQKINEQIIDDVKLEILRSAKNRKKPIDTDKALYTMEEYFENYVDENYKPDTFHENEVKLVEDMVLISNSKHYNHLSYLSKKHAHNKMKLRFIHRPFSFLFLIQGQNYYHLIWETLDTQEATYVWHSPKEIEFLKHTFREVELIINNLILNGKTDYIKLSNDNFDRIYHDYSTNENGFEKWKNDLEKVLK